ncbi:hypothetical protein BO86DRAFT_74910 [Aspergillus japonicus CBS 114.51]|uniref:Uncharacterized protein n=1 Tax=Aspergillus japonicus CBS 114.51 TaxID=1448312 RepID=A0A8T8XHX0_ASPJA|nr:hypothetical protein BO86DRAFT_74910 [Aspergillus japonicus CBS 114.51]RAH86962.1 hypothetical protein BO86DRAFT_74910 [Aspergillus japonicus CBS 114.51]
MGNFQTVLSSLFWIGTAITIQYMLTGPLPILFDILSNKMPDILSSLPPSPGWAPFWRRLFHSAPPAFSVWFCVRMAGLSYSIVIALMGYALIGAVDIGRLLLCPCTLRLSSMFFPSDLDGQT